MTRFCRRFGLTAVLVAALVAPASAVDLKTAWRTALDYDAELLAARASRNEAVEGVPVARSSLLPQIAYSRQSNRSHTITEYLQSSRPDVDSGHYDSGSSSLTLRQPIFRKQAWDAYQVAKSQALAAESGYQGDIQKAGLRVALSYLEVLAARAGVSLARKQAVSAEAWLTLAEEAFRLGRGTRTDVSDARSRRDMAKARETEAKMLHLAAAANFEVVSGIDAGKIPELDPLQLNPDSMAIVEKDQWLQRIEDASPELRSLREQLEAARSYVAQMQSGHLPTVDFVAARQHSESDSNTSIGIGYKTDYYGVQVNVPIFNGGGVSAQARQALEREEKVRQSLEATRRKTLAEGSRLYLAVSQGIEQVYALNQAVVSGGDAVQGERKGMQAGTRTIVDALEAERKLYESMRDQAAAVYSLAGNHLKFLALSGAIDDDAVEKVSAWLATAQH